MLYDEDEILIGEKKGQDMTLVFDALKWLLRNWYWILLGPAITLTAAYFQLRYAENMYSAGARILVKKEAVQQQSELSAITGGRFSQGTGESGMSDQIDLLKSHRLMDKVVKKTDFNVRYFVEGRVKTVELFPERSPVRVKILSEEPGSVNFEINTLKDSEIEVIHGGRKIRTSLGKPIKLGGTELTLLPQNGKKVFPGQNVQINVMSTGGAANFYRSRLSVLPAKEEGSLLNLSMVDNVPERAIIIINELISQYVEDAIADKQASTERTTQFIEDRLAKVAEDLDTKDRDIEQFKKDHKLISVQSEGGRWAGLSSGNYNEIITTNNQLGMVGFVEEYLKENQGEQIPANLGIQDGTTGSAITKLNGLIAERDVLLKSATENNRTVQNLNEQIELADGLLRESLSNYKKTLQISLSQTEREKQTNDSRVMLYPTQEREFRNIERQQGIVEGLYLFLLQKREENEIRNSATPSPVKVVDFASSSFSPISPIRKTTYMKAAAVGLAVPVGVLLLIFFLNTKVKGRKDVEGLGISIIGEIPSTRHEKRIQENDRSMLAEAFRILRTNISFYMTRKKEGSKNIFITSTISGEGKTFLASNLATILCASGKYKVALMGADIRNPILLKVLDLFRYRHEKGLTQFLIDESISPENLIIKDPEIPFDLIHAGKLAPNPAELLMTERAKELFEWLGQNYDYVVVDTAPVSMVADTQIIAHYADLFLYVIRVNYLDKKMLEMPKHLNQEKKLPNMALVINDVDEHSGYGIGYGGYGYGYISDAPPKGWRKYVPVKIRHRIKRILRLMRLRR